MCVSSRVRCFLFKMATMVLGRYKFQLSILILTECVESCLVCIGENFPHPPTNLTSFFFSSFLSQPKQGKRRQISTPFQNKTAVFPFKRKGAEHTFRRSRYLADRTRDVFGFQGLEAGFTSFQVESNHRALTVQIPRGITSHTALYSIHTASRSRSLQFGLRTAATPKGYSFCAEKDFPRPKLCRSFSITSTHTKPTAITWSFGHMGSGKLFPHVRNSERKLKELRHFRAQICAHFRSCPTNHTSLRETSDPQRHVTLSRVRLRMQKNT